MKLAVLLLAALVGAASASAPLGRPALGEGRPRRELRHRVGRTGTSSPWPPRPASANPPSGSQHLLITLDEEKTGKRIGDAEVVMEVTDPRGGMERKTLLHTQSGGMADYSELFVFGWSGRYSVRVIITPTSSAKPVETRFIVNHRI